MKKVTAIAVVEFVGIILALAGPAEAALIAYEGFNYGAATNVSGQNGGTGFAGASTWSIGTGSTTNLANDSLPAPAGTSFSPVGENFHVSGGMSAAYRELDVTNSALVSATAANSGIATTGLGLGGGTWYVSSEQPLYLSAVIERIDSATLSAWDFVGLAYGYVGSSTDVPSNGGYFRTGMGIGSTGVFAIAGLSGATIGSTGAAVMGAGAHTYFLVEKITPTNTGFTMALNVYDVTNGAIVPSLEPAYTITGSQPTNVTLTALQIYTGANSTALVDEIRLGTSWADVTQIIPEPASLSLLVLGGLALLRRRK